MIKNIFLRFHFECHFHSYFGGRDDLVLHIVSSLFS